MRTSCSLCLVSISTVWALALPPEALAADCASVEALTQRAVALSLAEAHQFEDAVQAATEALRVAPKCPEFYDALAQVLVAAAGPASEIDALERPVAGTDYRGIVVLLARASEALASAAKLQAGTPEMQETIARIGQLRVRALKAEAAVKLLTQQAADEQLERRAAEIERQEQQAKTKREREIEVKRQEEERTRAQAEGRRAQEVRVRRLIEEEEVAQRTGRAWGIGLLIAAGCAGGAAAISAVLAADTNSRVLGGGLRSSYDIEQTFHDGQTYNGLAIGLGIGAGVLAVIGLPVLLTHLGAATPSGAGVAW